MRRDVAAYPGAVKAQPFTQAVFHFTLIALALHVDEVDDDQATQVTQTQLAGNFFCRFQIGLEGGFFDVGAAC